MRNNLQRIRVDQLPEVGIASGWIFGLEKTVIQPHLGLMRMSRAHPVNGTLYLQATGILARSEEHTSELQSLMRSSYAVFFLQKKKPTNTNFTPHTIRHKAIFLQLH